MTSARTQSSPGVQGSEPPRDARRSAIFFTVNLLFIGISLAIVFGAAGTIRWGRGWAYVALVTLSVMAHRAYVARRNPGLLARRQRIGEGTKSWDKVWNALFWPMMMMILVIAAVDAARLHVSSMPLALWFVGASMLGGGLALSAWAMGSNPFFEGTVRIQKELGHRVIDTGPYARIRHPGYVGLILVALGSPFLLGSWYALLPAAIAAFWVGLRTSWEDSTLRRELEGYEDYSRRVRYRLVPGIW